MIHEILITKDFPKAPLYERLESPEFQQHNLFTSTNKQFHKARRRLVAPAFGLAYLRTLEPIMHDCIRKMIEKIDEILADPKSVRGKVLPRGQINIFQLMNRVALDIIGETAYGESFKMIEDDTNPLPHQMAKTLRRSMQQVYNPWMKYIFKQEWGLIEFGRACVRRRREAGEKGRRADLLQYLLDAQAREIAEGNGPTGDAHEDMITGKLTDNAVDMEAVIFIIAGSETSSTAITNTLMFLVNNPDKLKRLREELDLVTANNEPGTIPLHDQIRHCAYLTACINESMRIRPVAATGLPKEVDHDCTIGGYFFPKGTTVIVQIPQLHWNPEYFPEPNKYIPERWINEESPFPPVQDFTFYPFSAGTRNCVGKNFAMMEMRLILAILVLQFEYVYILERVRWQRTDYVQYITTTFATESYIIKMKRRQLATSV
ncbi:hypothetical protein BGW41_008162 [Actinomortierella wolfii]|nr:hypothetical protein BGW41_008162 [Actinomortierella wolfii]